MTSKCFPSPMEIVFLNVYLVDFISITLFLCYLSCRSIRVRSKGVLSGKKMLIDLVPVATYQHLSLLQRFMESLSFRFDGFHVGR